MLLRRCAPSVEATGGAALCIGAERSPCSPPRVIGSIRQDMTGKPRAASCALRGNDPAGAKWIREHVNVSAGRTLFRYPPDVL